MKLLNDSLELQSKLIILSKYILKALEMDKRDNKLGTNTCIASNIIPLVYDSFSMYELTTFIFKHLFEHDEGNNELTQEALPRYYSAYESLRIFYSAASSIKYVTDLCVVPKLPEEPPQFGAKPKKKKRQVPKKEEKLEEAKPKTPPSSNPLDFVWYQPQLSPTSQQNLPDSLVNNFQGMSFEPTPQPIFIPEPTFVPNITENSFERNRNTVVEDEETRQAVEQLKKMILQERDQAKDVFSKKDQAIEQWMKHCKQLSMENNDLQKILDSILKENEMLRQMIKKAKETHAEAVRTIIGCAKKTFFALIILIRKINFFNLGCRKSFG